MGRRGRTNLVECSTFFVTTTVVEFFNVFTQENYCDILLSNIKHYQERYSFKIIGYVIMPSHWHWIVDIDRTKGTISDIMRDIKKYSAWDLMEAMAKDGRTDFLESFEKNAQKHPGQNLKLWMPRFDDEAIRTHEMLRAKLEYIHNNPVRAGLADVPENFKYLSARNYKGDNDPVLNVDTEWLG
jgi:putative transposase